MKVIFICFLIIQSAIIVKGQNYIVEYFGKESGLLDRNLTSIQQDDLGFIWISTLNGNLYRYDGYDFLLFNKYLNLKLSTPIYALGKANNGNIWICGDGITVLNPSTLQITSYYSGSNIYGKNSNQQNLFFSFLRGPNNDIWLTSSSGIFVVHNDDLNQLSQIQVENPLNLDPEHILLDENNNIWLYTLKSLHLFEDGIFKQRPINKQINLGKSIIFPTVNIKNEILGYYVEDLNSTYSLDNKLLSKGNKIDSIVNWNFIRKYFSNLDSKLKTLANNKNQRWFTTFTSTDQTIWIGTYAGLFKLTPNNRIFSSIVSLSNHSIRAFYEDKQTSNLYFGTYNGLLKFNPTNNKTSYLNNKLAYKILYKKGKRILVMTEIDGLKWWNLENGYEIKVNTGEQGISNSTATYIIKDTLYFAFRSKIYKYDLNIEKLYSENINLSKKIDSINGNIYSIFINSNHEFWISTNEGVICLDQYGKNIHQSILGKPYFTNDIFITSFYEDNSKQLWLTSKNYGIFNINLEQKLIEHYTQKDGLANDETYGILCNNDGSSLWISTANGLSNFDNKKKQFKNYYENEGIANNEFNRCAYYQSSDGTFYFGGINGVTFFKPDNIKKENISFLPILSSYKIYNSKGDVKTYPYLGKINDNIVLKSTDNIIEFQVSSSDYVDLSKRTYKFFLEGFDNDWSSTTNSNNTIRYTNLPAGNYTLNLKSIGGLGEWSNNILSVKIIILQPFYKSFWFFVFILSLFLIFLYLIFKYRIAQIKKYNDIRLSIGTNLHDELGGTLYAINFTANSLVDANNYDLSKLQTLKSLCQKAYKNMSDIIWAINPENQTFEKLMIKMDDEAISILGNYYSSYHFKTENVNIKSKIRLDIAHHILMIYKEALVNIIKHTVPTSIEVKLNNSPIFELEISNNYNLVSYSELRSGNGLNNIKKRSQQINGKLEIHNNTNFFKIKIILKEKL